MTTTASIVTAGTVLGKPAVSAAIACNKLPSLHWQKNREINWNDFNYPPVVRLIHYNAKELPGSLQGTVHCLHLGFIVVFVACWVNFLDTLILVPGGGQPASWLIQSMLHLVLLPSFALGTFYIGYRGLAEPNTALVARYKWVQLALMLVFVIFSIVPTGCVNGIWRVQTVGSAPGLAGFWTAATLVESLLWTLAAGLALAGFILVPKRSAQAQSEANSGGLP
eukprot:TRINITY_DN29359_c0_g1_i1.p1 TRINITY_DN29359_c0_g1~~TRINITY_DN29359_c0_g1_i1.p1  ORF type:complete len:223 (+),score=39.64 TRINITY_DN29359_c0_g1_i1:68-736(+)